MAAIGLFLLALTSAAVLFSHSNSIENEEFEQKWGVKNVVPDVLGDGEVVKRQTTGTIVHFTQAEKDAILNRHNELRGQVSPSAQDMEYMYWDDNNANTAEQWVATCTWGHSQSGENMWATPGTLGSPPGGLSATNSWARETKNYDFDANTCSGVCGHYTQLAWSNTNRLGCGAAFCPDSAGSESGDWIVACHYSPYGNTGGRPYEKGPSCAWCRSGSGWCFKNKCRDCKTDGVTCDCPNKCQHCGTKNDNECTCSCQKGWWGPDCQEECKDEVGYSWCWSGYSGSCQSYYYLIAKHCPVMCGDCEVATGSDPPCNE
ncbi:cysteine-rich venom protein LEI1-like [Amphiura filiformis]|uniref:cysteine-rich venom protein LEI1-like n=1 Tax=Amphiura filiformis TaxID=82378 RepID=UPI003B217802